jgi:hypothetical protein
MTTKIILLLAKCLNHNKVKNQPKENLKEVVVKLVRTEKIRLMSRWLTMMKKITYFHFFSFIELMVI